MDPASSGKAATRAGEADPRGTPRARAGRRGLDPLGCCSVNQIRKEAGVGCWNLGVGMHALGARSALLFREENAASEVLWSPRSVKDDQTGGLEGEDCG